VKTSITFHDPHVFIRVTFISLNNS